MIKATGVDVARNYLAMGSGFYEASDDGSDVPSVLADIVRQLQRTGLLTRAPEVDIFVNPNACQAVVVSITSIRERGWRVRKAGKPEKLFGKADRALHAKFIFGANSRENSNVCNSAWIYFGSGNLTTPGFSQKISRNGGNLEAGVVFAPRDQLLWFSENNAEQYRVVTNVLPVQCDQKFDEVAGNLRAGGDMPEREEEFVAVPVAYLVWRAAGNALLGGWLMVPNEEVTSFEVVDTNGAVCPRDEENGIRWPDEQPRQVRLCWQTGGQQQTSWVGQRVDDYLAFAPGTIRIRATLRQAGAMSG